MIIMAANVDESIRLAVTMAGIWGIVVHISACKFSSHLLGGEPEIDEMVNAVTHDASGAASGVVAGFGGFLYLGSPDASFSFDGVIGAFQLLVMLSSLC